MPSPTERPLRRTRYVAREIAYGRETLRRLTRARGTLAGWEAVTLRTLASELAASTLATAGIAIADDVLLAALADEVIDALTAARTLPPVLAGLSLRLGVRTAAWDAIAQLRLAGITPEQLKAAARPGSAAAAMAPILAGYERLISERKIGDAASVFRAAIEAIVASTEPFVDHILIEAGAAEVSGLPASFIDALVGRGAEREPAGSAQPTFVAAELTLDITRAATPLDEVRHALRSALSEGLRWDDIEIATTDADTYGVALAALGERLGIPFTLKEGVPLARTRIGRARDRFLAWLTNGLSATTLREMLERGDLAIDGLTQDVSVAARTLRAARVGWGRARWDHACARFDDGTWAASVRTSRDEELSAMDHDARRAELAVRAADAARVLHAVLAITPPVPELGDRETIVTSTVPALANSVRAWLSLLEPTASTDDERATVARLAGRLDAIARDASPATLTFGAALATIQQGISDLRAFPSLTGDRAPRTSLPGHVHLTDVTHAGVTGRPRIFVLGLDADRCAGGRIPDPILDDRTREQLGAALPTTPRRAERRRTLIGRALAALGGRVTLSYATAADGVGREASPSSWLLDAMRATKARPTLSYDQFRAEVGVPASAVPGAAQRALDARDVWLGALASGHVTLDGVDAVDEAFPALARGHALLSERYAPVAGEWLGLVPDAAGALGPIARPERAVSPTSLELLATCPLKWFYQKGLGLQEPDDVEFDGGLWLDPAQRGSLLHEAFEQFVSEWMHRTAELAGAATMDAARTLLVNIANAWRANVPPPSEFVFQRELRDLERLMRAFLQAEREDFADGRTSAWREAERAFPGKGGAPVLYDLGGGQSLRIAGRIDRIDTVAGGALRVVDYKTGSSYNYRRDAKDPPCNGGRHLQPALYSSAAEQALGHAVASFEYRFPKEPPPRHRQQWLASEFASARPVVRSLLTHAERGHFVPTDDPGDCKLCAYSAVCRVTVREWDVSSPRAAWAKQQGEHAPEFVELRRRRGEVST